MKREKSCGCIVFDGTKILLVQHLKGHWGFPKGHVEENETEQETAIREVKEETNIDVAIQGENRYVEEYITDTGIDKQVVYFIAKKIGGDLIAQETEIKNIEWVEIGEVLEKLTYENVKNLFEKVLKDINYT